MIARVEAGDISAEEVAAEAPLHQGEAVGVTIILSGNVEEVMDFLQANGGTNLVAGEDYIEGFIPVLLLGRTSEQTGVEKVQLVQPPDSPQSQSAMDGNGPAVHSSIDWNQAGYNGQGIKIGIIDTGFTGFRELMGNELPSAVQVRCYPGWNQPTADLDDCDNGLLFELSANAGRVMTYDRLLQRVWGLRSSGDSRRVRTAAKQLRRKLGDDANNPTYILNEPRVGYRMAKREAKGTDAS